MSPPNPWSGVKLFEVMAKDGRRVCIHEEWYHHHVIQRKKEIGSWLAEPLEEIKRALTDAVQIKQGDKDRLVYVGPPIGKGFCRNNCLHVAVQPDKKNRGVVFTVVMK